ncbi:MAG: DUF1178 family protein, partial [Pseudomonadota bacterium]
MIRYQLKCDKDHGFEAWFNNSAAYEKQVKRKLVTCPECGSTKVSKAIMAPNVGVKGNKKSDLSVPVRQPDRPEPVDPKVAAAQQEIMAAMRKLRKTVEENAEYVGPRFAEEARKIHYKESEEKGIYGEASPSDVQDLIEEGVEIHPLPVLPED